MTGARINVDDADILAGLKRIAALGDDPEPALLAIGQILQASTLERFRTETDPTGKPWAPLNKEYAKGRIQGKPILTQHGTLSQIVYQLAERSVAVGTNAIYGATHQFGATIKPKNAPALVFELAGAKVFAAKVEIPERPFLGISPDDREEILGTLQDVIAGAMRGEP